MFGNNRRTRLPLMWCLLSKKPKRPIPVIQEKPRLLARISGYTSSTYMALEDAGECPPKEWTDENSKATRSAEEDAKAHRAEMRRQIAKKVAEVRGQKAFRWI